MPLPWDGSQDPGYLGWQKNILCFLVIDNCEVDTVIAIIKQDSHSINILYKLRDCGGSLKIS